MQRIMTWTRCGICRAEAVPFKNASRTSDGDGVSMGGSGRVDDAMPHLGGPPPPPMNLERHPGLLGTGVLGSGQVSLMMVGGRLRRQQVTEMPPRGDDIGPFPARPRPQPTWNCQLHQVAMPVRSTKLPPSTGTPSGMPGPADTPPPPLEKPTMLPSACSPPLGQLWTLHPAASRDTVTYI